MTILAINSRIKFIDANGIRQNALFKSQNAVATDPDVTHQLEKNLGPAISLAYIDPTGTVQTINNVPHVSTLAAGAPIVSVWSYDS